MPRAQGLQLRAASGTANPFAELVWHPTCSLLARMSMRLASRLGLGWACILALGACGAESTPLASEHAAVGEVQPPRCDPPNVLLFTKPGCGDDVQPTCETGSAGACATLACSCKGEIIYGRCNGLSERFQADAGRGPHALSRSRVWLAVDRRVRIFLASARRGSHSPLLASCLAADGRNAEVVTMGGTQLSSERATQIPGAGLVEIFGKGTATAAPGSVQS